MAIKLIVDTTNYNKYYNFIIENVEYIVHLYWNNELASRGFSNSGWYLSVYDPELFIKGDLSVDNSDALILGGVKLMPNSNLFLISNTDKLPDGWLGCVDTKPEKGFQDYTISLDNFGTNKRFQLVYFTKEEVRQAIALGGN